MLTLQCRHGKDHKLSVWMFHSDEEPSLNKTLPLDTARPGTPGSQPKLVYSLSVNALNFCSFSMLFLEDPKDVSSSDYSPYKAGMQSKGTATAQTPEQSGDFGEGNGNPETYDQKEMAGDAKQSEDPKRCQPKDTTKAATLQPPEHFVTPSLIAVPNTLNSGAIDIFHLPLKRRVSTIRADSTTQTGMLMAVNIFLSTAGHLHVASAFESGHVMLFVCRDKYFRDESALLTSDITKAWRWECVYSHMSHKQPALSICLSPKKDYFISSAADGALVKHPVPNASPAGASVAGAGHSPLAIQKTAHSGQQSLHMRSDGRVFATACWDKAARLYYCETLQLKSTLTWNKDGCAVLAFADLDASQEPRVRPRADEPDPGSFHRGEKTLGGLLQRRARKVHQTRWLAVGTKTGPICLWEVY